MNAQRINHSCVPNAATSYSATRKLLSVHALFPLPPQTEITISYINPIMRLEDRQGLLWSQYRFHCRCPTCALGLGRVLEHDDPLLVEERKKEEDAARRGPSTAEDESAPAGEVVVAAAAAPTIVLPGTDPHASAQSELRRKRICVLYNLLDGWEARRVPGWTVMKISRDVLGPGEIVDTEGLEALKGDLWRAICRVGASHSSCVPAPAPAPFPVLV